jgi:AraC-like DNA-binding protein
MTNPRGNFSLELSSLDAELFSLVHYHLQSPSSSSSTDPTGLLLLGLVDSGALALGSSRGPIDTSMPWLFPQEQVRGDWDEITITALSVSIPDALRLARAQLGDDRFKLQFVGTAPLSPARGAQWANLVRYLRKNMEQDDPVIASDLVLASTHAHLISMLLATFPNNAMDALFDRHESTALPSAVRRAIQYMESNAHRPITVEDIARESRLSIRGLQYAFRSSLESSPSTYLRRIRLAGAHSALQAASPDDGSTVAGIALTWVFPHPSRFAKQYRAAYGVSPRRTLES